MDSIEFKDHSAECKEEIESRALKALTMCGMVVERAAKQLATVDTGLLRNSITLALAGRKPAVQSYKADKPKNGVIQTGEYSGAAPMMMNYPFMSVQTLNMLHMWSLERRDRKRSRS